MNIIDNFLKALAVKKLGADFDEKLIEYLENHSCDQDEIFNEIIEHYQAIFELLSTDYQSVKLDRNDLTTVYIDGKKYDLDDKSSAKGKKSAEHRMAIESLIPDAGADCSDVMARIERHFNNR